MRLPGIWNEELLRQEIRVFNIDEECIDIKDIVRLATMFVVPYRTMIRRLRETGILTGKKYEKYAFCTERQAEQWRMRLGLSIPTRENKIGLSTLVDQAMSLYEKNLITYERLAYLLAFSKLTPDDMGVKEEASYQPPSDEELDAIMEE